MIGDGTEQTIEISDSDYPTTWPWKGKQVKSVRFDGIVHGIGNMTGMFMDVSSETIDLSGFDTSQTTSMNRMFCGSEAKTINFSGFDTSSATNMEAMFSDLQTEELDLSGFDTSHVTNMCAMFSHCYARSIDLSSFDTSSTDNLRSMFCDCKHLESIDFSSFDTRNEPDMENILVYNWYLSKITLGQNFRFNNFVPSEEKPFNEEWIREDGSYGPMNLAELSEVYDTDPEKYAGTWILAE